MVLRIPAGKTGMCASNYPRIFVLVRVGVMPLVVSPLSIHFILRVSTVSAIKLLAIVQSEWRCHFFAVQHQSEVSQSHGNSQDPGVFN